MLRNPGGLCPLLLITAIRSKSTSSSSHVGRQSKILGKLFGNRLAGSKKRWYPVHEASPNGQQQPPSVAFQASQFGKSNNAPGAKHNVRRMSVLNKLFMTQITDLLATGAAAESILGRGLQVSRVKISADFAVINVYWLGSGDTLRDAELEVELQRYSGQLRHELSQLRLMGEVPRIKFVRDRTGSNLNQVEGILRHLDLPARETEQEEPEEEFDVAQTARQEFYGQVCDPSFSSMPEMRHDVLGLDHRLMMDKILAKMRKSRQAWEQHRYQQEHEPEPPLAPAKLMTEEASNKFEAFLAKRRQLKDTPERKKYRREQDYWPDSQMDAEHGQQLMPEQPEDYLDEEDKTPNRGSR